MRIKRIAPLFFTIMIDTFGFGLVLPVFTALFLSENSPLFAASAPHATRLLFLGFAYTLYPLGMFFGASYLGDLSDAIGRKKILLYSIAGLFISYILIGIGIQFSWIYLILFGRLINGLMAGNQPAALASLIDLSTKENKAIMLSIIAIANSIGVVLGTTIGGLLSDPQFVSFFNYTTPMYFSAILACIAFLWVWGAFTDNFVPKKNAKVHPLRCITSLIEAAKNRQVLYIAICFFIMELGIIFFMQTIQIYLETFYNYSSFLLGMYNGMLGVGYTISLLVIFPLMLRIMNVKWVVVNMMFGAGVILVAIGLFKSLAVAWILGFIMTLFHNMAYTGFFATMSDAVIKTKQGWAMGITASTMAVSFAIGGFQLDLVPYLGILNVIIIGGALYFVSALLMIIYNKRIYKKPREPRKAKAK